MTKRLFVVVSLLLVVAIAALAADLTGKWTGSQPGRDGAAMSVTYTLKQDGDKLTGTAPGRGGAEGSPLEGKVTGNDFTLTVTSGRGPQEWKGTIKGADEIVIKRETQRGPTELTLKRAK